MGLFDGDKALAHLIGQRVSAVYFSEDLLTFVNDVGHTLSFQVEGDCCSHSYFADFVGLDKLLGNKVIEVGEIELTDDDKALLAHYGVKHEIPWEDYEDIKVYGYKIVTEHPQWGPVTSVFSFRNSSNGYYGGWMTNVQGRIDTSQVLLTEDKVAD